MHKILRFFLLVILLSLPTQVSLCKSAICVNDSLILAAVRNSDISSLNDLVKMPVEINRQFGKQGRTLLTYAVEYGQLESVNFLIDKGSAIEQLNQRKTPLMFAARYGRPLIANILIKEGADINMINGESNTAFHYAAKYNNIEILQILHENKAKINIHNQDNWTALDFALLNNREDIKDYLIGIGCILLKKDIPDYFDGPYIDISGPGKLNIKYLVNKDNESSILSKEIIADKGVTKVPGLKSDKNTYYITSEPIAPPCYYEDQSRIFVMGDIHGQYERMIKMLKAGGVIDKNLHWTWGDGHLVFIGDILDRGEGVTEALWLIYRLEREAEISKGRVHLLIGNHELMILQNDIRYIANKYYSLCSNLHIDYHSLFSNSTVLGRWLRTKNVVEIIGKTMFIHAGISPELAAMDFTVEEINNSFRGYLCSDSLIINPEHIKLLIGSFGPVWYRGYIRSSSRYEEIGQENLDSILNQYAVQQVVVGHTEVDEIIPVKNGKVIPVNIPLADKTIIEQALIIEDNLFYRLTSKKSRNILHHQPKN